MPSVPTEVIRTHLELCDQTALRPAAEPRVRAHLTEVVRLAARDYRSLYIDVGERWHWCDRLAWTDAELDAYLGLPEVHVWTLQLGDERAGFFELLRHEDARVEIMYFGLAGSFIGLGLGGWMLTRAVEESFALGATCVVLNTCTLDAPTALPNYLARGFRIVREERFMKDLHLDM